MLARLAGQARGPPRPFSRTLLGGRRKASLFVGSRIHGRDWLGLPQRRSPDRPAFLGVLRVTAPVSFAVPCLHLCFACRRAYLTSRQHHSAVRRINGPPRLCTKGRKHFRGCEWWIRTERGAEVQQMAAFIGGNTLEAGPTKIKHIKSPSCERPPGGRYCKGLPRRLGGPLGHFSRGRLHDRQPCDALAADARRLMCPYSRLTDRFSGATAQASFPKLDCLL